MKKWISFFLVLALLLSLPAVSAFAEDALTWDLSKDGTLSIRGRGEMHDFTSDVAPWRSYKNEVTSIYVEDGVTHIGSQAFQYMSHVRSASLPDSVESLGDAAFYDCARLEAINLPILLTELPTSAFDHCSALKSVVIPYLVEEIGEAAFNCCSALESVYIPSVVEMIGSSAFNSCTRLRTVYFGGTERQWNDIEIGSYNKSLLNAKIVFNASSFDVSAAAGTPSSDTSAAGSIRWSLSKDMTLTLSGTGRMPDYSTDTPPWVKEREEIRKVVVESGITHIGAQSFQFCKNLKSVTLPDTVTSIGDAAFYKCTSLKEIALPAGLAELGKLAFDHCTKLREVSVPGGVSVIRESAFNCCEELETVSLPRSITQIENSAFNGCKKLADVYFEGSASDWAAIRIDSYNRPLSSAYVHTAGAPDSAIAGGVL